MFNEITLRNKIIDKCNSDFMNNVRKTAVLSGVEAKFDVKEFTEMTLDEAIIKHVEFGIVYPVESSFEFSGLPHSIIMNEITFMIEVCFIARKQLANQISLIRIGLVNTMANLEEDIIEMSGIRIETTSPIDFGALDDDNDTRYVGCGINAKLKIGMN